MGSSQSTRWRGYVPKSLVEDAVSLDLLDPHWTEIFKHPEAEAHGTIELAPASSHPRQPRVDYIVEPVRSDGTRRLGLGSCDSLSEAGQVLILETLQVGFDPRVYARCPKGCRKRVRKLYLEPERELFRCRRCSGLQYRSVQEHDKRVDRLLRNPVAFAMAWKQSNRSIRSDATRAGLVLKAAWRLGRGRDLEISKLLGIQLSDHLFATNEGPDDDE